MYFMGHAALGTLAGLPLALPSRGRPGRDPLGLTPGLLLLLVLSPNLPDALHVDPLRPWTHNMAVGAAMSLALALGMRRPLALSRGDAAAVAAAFVGHPVGDMLFGCCYHPLFPFVPTSTFASPFLWNTPPDFLVEVPLTALPLVLLYHPRVAGRALRGRWLPWGHPLVFLAGGAVAIGLGGNLAVLALTALLGAHREAAALLLFAEGLLLLAALLPRPRARGRLSGDLRAPRAPRAPAR